MNSLNRNAIGDWFRSDKVHEEEMAKYEAMMALANKPAQTSTLIYMIPIVGILVMGVIIAVAMKKHKS